MKGDQNEMKERDLMEELLAEVREMKGMVMAGVMAESRVEVLPKEESKDIGEDPNVKSMGERNSDSSAGLEQSLQEVKRILLF
mmetsp:Transcript_33977/g.25064  ORF Transcript_33977/g.25064 Transcript_33977/m.25064 type:complete len:83 (+) Transcript_33977:305-553(+)